MFSRLLGLGAAACLLAGTAAGTTASASTRAAGGIWQVLATVNPQAHQVTNSAFASVSMPSATEGWAVGAFDDKNAVGHPLVEHWDGTTWTLGKAPQPSGRAAQLAGVDELSASNVWAAGFSEGRGGVTSDLPLIEHWDGAAWSIVRGASLPAGSPGLLNAIGGSGPGDLWAVGFTLNAGATQEQVLFEHFDGTSWRQASFPGQTAACDPNAADCFLDPKAVSATSPNDVWVVGTVLEPNPAANFVAHWNGTAWSVVPAPCLTGTTVTAACSFASVDENQLTGVIAISANDAWASGSEGNVNNANFHIPYVEHWNGTAWSLVKTPNPNSHGEGSLLNGITAPGPGDIWAVGQTQGLNGAIRSLTEQFNGTAWSLVHSPSPGSSPPDDSLSGAASPGAGIVFAVGARNKTGQCCLRTFALKTTAG